MLGLLCSHSVRSALVLVFNGGVTRTLTRFSSLQDDRLNYWHDIGWALKHYGLAGTGFGTFVPIYQSAESLESVVPQYINHAHNDYLELLLEGGVPAACLLLCFLVVMALLLLQSSKSGRAPERPLINLAAAAGILVLMLFSLVDFPLRMPALSAPFALLCATLLPTRISRQSATGSELAAVARTRLNPKLVVARLGAVMLLLAATLLSVEAGFSASSIANGRFQEAASVAFWSTRAHEREATFQLMRLNDGAASAAQHAIRLSPINASAIRTLGLLRLEEGNARAGNRLHGCRGKSRLARSADAIVVDQRRRTDARAGQGGSARRGSFPAGHPSSPLQLLLGAPDFEPMSRLLAGRLAQRPTWRPQLLHNIGGLSPPNLTRFEEILSTLSRSPYPATMDEIKPVLQALVSQGRTLEAQHLWLQLNPAFIDNGDFDARAEVQGVLSPAGWDVPLQNRRSVAVARPQPDRRNRALRIGPTDWVTILAQDTMLAAGSYTMTYAARETGPSPVALRWQLRCRGARDTQVTQAQVLPHQGWHASVATFVVPQRDCLIQRIALKRIEADDQSETWVDSVHIAPASR